VRALARAAAKTKPRFAIEREAHSRKTARR
jgi:hypothetical protein